MDDVNTQYLTFTEVYDSGRTKVWRVLSRSRGDWLATIKWYGPWRQYTFHPQPDTTWNTGCLADVQAFIAARMTEWRASR